MKSRVPVIIAFLLLTLVAVPAFAAGPYVGAEGGAVFLSTSTFTPEGGGGGDLKSKTGYGLGLLGGFDFGMWRLEGEFAYRKNDNKEITNPTEPVSGDVSTMALMVNGYYDFRMVSPTFVPYIGGGIGGARVAAKLIDSAGVTMIDEASNVFAYQFAAGVGFPISKELTLDLGYKYFATAEPEFESHGTKVKGEYASHNIFLGARYNF